MKQTKGFTLIETLIYIALFSTIIFSALIVAFNLIEGSEKLEGKNVLQEEGNFLMSKIDWALTGVQSFSISGSTCSGALSITKDGFTENPIEIDLDSGKVRLRDGGSNFLPLTTPNVSVSCLDFIDVPTVGSAPRGVKIKVVINGQTFDMTKYIRK